MCVMKDLKLLTRRNVVKTVECGAHLKLITSEPSSDSKLFSVERKRNSVFSSFTSFVRLCIVLATLIGSIYAQRIPHEEFKRFVSVLVWMIGVLVWMLHSIQRGRSIVSESVLAVHGVGLQLFSETRSGDITNLVFIETPTIHEILIIEGFTALKVITYIGIELCSKKSGKSSLVIPFQHFELPTNLSVDVVRGLRETLDLNDSPDS